MAEHMELENDLDKSVSIYFCTATVKVAMKSKWTILVIMEYFRM